MTDNPLGRDSAYPDRYAPELLYPIAREDARAPLGIAGQLPFRGADVWNAWELTWLDDGGKPMVATATVSVPAESANIVESKSFKLYLNSFAQSRYRSPDALRDVIARDIGRVAGASVQVSLAQPDAWRSRAVSALPGTLIDDLDCDGCAADVDASLLATAGDRIVDDELHSHLLRSLCPVTGQPDTGSVSVRYRGPRIDPSSLLGYIVSFRRHNDFHEACVERMFVDIKARCDCETLTVHARYNRRGGIDINPFRTDTDAEPDNLRLWRQ